MLHDFNFFIDGRVSGEIRSIITLSKIEQAKGGK